MMTMLGFAADADAYATAQVLINVSSFISWAAAGFLEYFGGPDTIAMAPLRGMDGVMPHPEDHVLDWQRPSGPEGGSGLPLFEAFVAAAR